MKMLMLGAVCAAGLLFTGCASCKDGACSKSSGACAMPAATACASCAKCSKDAAGCATCCKTAEGCAKCCGSK